MTKIYLTALLSLILFTTGISQGIEFFQGEWKDALETAKQQEKLLFVDAYTTWCGPCKKMSSTVFTQNEVGAFFNENFINIKLDMEKQDGMSFGIKYPVSAYPTMFFISGDGEVVYKITGFRPAPKFLTEGETAVKKYDRSGDFAAEYENGNRDYEFMQKYIQALIKAEKPSLKIANEYINSKPEISEEEMAMFYFSAAIESDSRIFDKMIDQKELILDSISQEEWSDKILYTCRNTVDNAIEYEYYELISDAVQKIKSELGKDVSKKFECESNIAYYKSLGDFNLYIDNMKKYVKKISKKDAIGLQYAINDLMTSFKEEEANKELASEAAERLCKLEDSTENQIQYARVLTVIGEQSKAKEVLEKERERIIKAGESTKMIDLAINRIKNS